MNRFPALRRPLLATLPTPARRAMGLGLLTLSLWFASFLAMWQ